MGAPRLTNTGADLTNEYARASLLPYDFDAADDGEREHDAGWTRPRAVLNRSGRKTKALILYKVDRQSITGKKQRKY
jgi:hypothetical protein